MAGFFSNNGELTPPVRAISDDKHQSAGGWCGNARGVDDGKFIGRIGRGRCELF